MSVGLDSAVRFYGAEPHYMVGMTYCRRSDDSDLVICCARWYRRYVILA